MREQKPIGVKLGFALAIAFLLMTAFLAGNARADQAPKFHLEPEAEEVIKQKGLVLYRIIDGPVRCYWIIHDVRMIGSQATISCVILDKSKETK